MGFVLYAMRGGRRTLAGPPVYTYPDGIPR